MNFLVYLSMRMINNNKKAAYMNTEFNEKKIANDIESYLASIGIVGEIKNIIPSSLITTLQFYPKSGFKLPGDFNIGDIKCYVPHPSLVGYEYINIEIHNMNRQIVWLNPLINNKKFVESNSKIPLIFGVGADNNPIYYDLATANNILITGDKGRGKSVLLHSFIMALVSKSKKILIIDTKDDEYKSWAALPNLCQPIINNPEQAIQTLQNISCDVVIIDDISDLLSINEKATIQAIKKAQASGIHFIAAMRTPQSQINDLFPSRILFKTAGNNETEYLCPYGDMLFSANGRIPARIHTPWICEEEIKKALK